MIRVGLIGLGFMGRGHLENYIKLEAEGYDVKLVAVCDCDESKFGGTITGNLDVGGATYDFSKYAQYTDYKKMLAEQELDYVDVVTPTYCHAEVSIYALNKGFHVFCEKPMALNPQQCDEMLAAAKANNRHLMIGQCLRFWAEYCVLKDFVNNGKLGKPLMGMFYRGGGTPRWSYQNWMLQEEKSGGALLDQHIHDVDMIHWVFGRPTEVSALTAQVFPNSGNDAVSTHYRFGDSTLRACAQDDWALDGSGFGMLYRVNFEKGCIIFERGQISVLDATGNAVPFEMKSGEAYYSELKHFIDVVAGRAVIEENKPESSRDTIAIAMAEMASSKANGDWTKVVY